MVFKSNDDISKVIKANCNCGCNAEIQIMKVQDDEEYYLTFHNSKFDEEQIGVFRLIGMRLKRAWCSLIGKDYKYMEICFSENEIKDFAKLINGMCKKK